MNSGAWRYGDVEKWGLRRDDEMEDWWNSGWRNEKMESWMKNGMEV